MARKPMTKAQREAALKSVGVKPKKIRKKRKMTAEQKAAAAARLAKARANRGPAKNSQVAENVRNLPEDNPLSMKKVRSWIKENKELLTAIKVFKDSKDSKERSKYQQVETYVANLEAYLRNGVYLDNYYGSQMQHKIQHRVVVMAYYPDGTPKRTVGWYYPDCGLYTKEMADEDNARA